MCEKCENLPSPLERMQSGAGTQYGRLFGWSKWKTLEELLADERLFPVSKIERERKP